MLSGKINYKTKSKQKNKEILLSFVSYVIVIGFITVTMLSI